MFLFEFLINEKFRVAKGNTFQEGIDLAIDRVCVCRALMWLKIKTGKPQLEIASPVVHHACVDSCREQIFQSARGGVHTNGMGQFADEVVIL